MSQYILSQNKQVNQQHNNFEADTTQINIYKSIHSYSTSFSFLSSNQDEFFLMNMGLSKGYSIIFAIFFRVTLLLDDVFYFLFQKSWVNFFYLLLSECNNFCIIFGIMFIVIIPIPDVKDGLSIKITAIIVCFTAITAYS